MIISPLSHREMLVLRLLSQGKSYRKICDLLNLIPGAQVTMESLYSTCYFIREKTGIQNTRDARECRAVLRQRHFTGADAPRGEEPTHQQMAVLRLVAQGKPYREIAAILGLVNSGAQSVQNYASQGCKRIGIRVPPWQRTHAIRQWLEAYDAKRQAVDPMDDPMF